MITIVTPVIVCTRVVPVIRSLLMDGTVIVTFSTHLVTNLAALFAAAELTLRLETVVPIHSDHPTVN